MKQVDMLLEYGLIPTFVFDGSPLPAKLEENIKRDKDKQTHLHLAKELEELGDPDAATGEFQKAVKVTPDMLCVIVKELKSRGLDFIIAPYEADAQVAFLCKQGMVDAVIAEDADMIPYGCSRVFFKLDRRGYCSEFKYSNLSSFNDVCLTKGKRKSKCLNLKGFTHDQIVMMVVFAGCDYLNCVSKIKLGRAYQLGRDFIDYRQAIEYAKSQDIVFPEEYEESFHRAMMTYRHQTVYDPEREAAVHLSPCNDAKDDEDLDYLGQLIPNWLAKGIALGEINPHTGLRYEVDEEKVVNFPNQESEFDSDGELQIMVPKCTTIEHTWKFWCQSPFVASSSSGASIQTFSTYEEFLRSYNVLPLPSQLVLGERLCLFRKEIEPEWGDPACADGGMWTVRVPKSEADRRWLQLIQAMVGEEMEHSVEVCGGSLKVGLNGVKMSVWTRNAANKGIQMDIGRQLKGMMEYKYVIGYIFHEDAKQVMRGAKNKYTT